MKELFDRLSSDEQKRFFIVSEVKYDESLTENKGKVAYVKVNHVHGEKCKRCWNYYDEKDLTLVDGNYICPRCLKALKK